MLIDRGRCEHSKNGGGSDNIFAETGVAPDPPRAPVAHHPHHPGLKPHALTAAEYEAKLGKDIHGNPLPKPKGKKARAGEDADEPKKAVRQSQAAAGAAAPLARGWVEKYDASKGKHFYLNADKHAVTWKRSVAAENKGSAQPDEAPLAAGWVRKYDASKGKHFYVNADKVLPLFCEQHTHKLRARVQSSHMRTRVACVRSATHITRRLQHAITWRRPVAGAEATGGSAPDAKLDARLARDVVHQPHFKHPNARNPVYEGSGQELDEALHYNQRAVENAKEYYAQIEEKRNLQHRVSKKGSTLTKLGSRAFFKFDPVKGSFYKYSPDLGAVAKPGSIADTLAKVAASAKTPTITVSSNGPALPNGDIKAAARAAPKQRFTQKAKKAVDMRATPEYKAAAAKADSALMNVARTVAINAGYKPAAAHSGGKAHTAAHHKAAPKKGKKTAAGGNKGKAKAADAKEDNKADAKKASEPAAAAGDVVAGHSLDPDWQARRY
jgi:hypothetical protein